MVERISREFREEPARIFFGNVDTSILDSTASMKYELIVDLRINKVVDSLQNYLRLLQRKVALQLEISYSSFRAMADFVQMRRELVDSIVNQCPGLIDQIDRGLEVIRKGLDP